MGNPLAEIDALPEPLRQRAIYSVKGVQAYGGKLESVDIRCCGGVMHCILHFDYTTIQFVAYIRALDQNQQVTAPLTALQVEMPWPKWTAWQE
jgi:hypothetical protein